MKQSTESNFSFCLTGAATDIGRVRRANEDSMGVIEVGGMKVFVVCDGMGGHVGGKVASETAIAAIRDFLYNNVCVDPREAIHNAIIVANEAILNRVNQQPELNGMGSTCVMLTVASDGKVYYGHVGDSRIYVVADRRIKQLTTDHSFVQTLVDAGHITKAQAEQHPRRNEITNALGLPHMQPPTVCTHPIEPDSGNCFILCSDGLSGMVSDEQIQRVISKHVEPIQQRAEKLVQMANNNGGVDNITVQLVEFAVSAQDISGTKKDDSSAVLKKLLFILLPLLLVLGGLIWAILTEPWAQSKDDGENKAATEGTGNPEVKTLKDTIEYRISFPQTDESADTSDQQGTTPQHLKEIKIDIPDKHVVYIRRGKDTILYISEFPKVFREIILVDDRKGTRYSPNLPNNLQGVKVGVNTDKNVVIEWEYGELPENEKVTVKLKATQAGKEVYCRISFFLKEKKQEKPENIKTEKQKEPDNTDPKEQKDLEDAMEKEKNNNEEAEIGNDQQSE